VKEEEEAQKELGNFTVNDLIPLGQAVTFGGLSGFCSGFVMKKVGKAAAATFGFIFIGFQVRERESSLYPNGGILDNTPPSSSSSCT